MKLMIGLMSGTSMDGIDAALVDCDTHRLIAGLTEPYSLKVQQLLQSVLQGESGNFATFSQLHTLLGREFAGVANLLLKHAGVSPEEITAIGSHGQTICHDTAADPPYTLQLGCAHTIAELTGIRVVADFRTRDLVIGGQGAPFAPIYHQTLFGASELPLGVVNIGGIANVTVLSPDVGARGSDVGPGNCLLDHWVQNHLNVPYDAHGKWAATGNVILPLLNALSDDPVFNRPWPNSLGKEYFSDCWLSNYLQPQFLPQDVQRTLLVLTATKIAEAIKKFQLKRVAICGGGVHNDGLMIELANQLPNVKVNSTQILGVDPDFIEAMMFAWLAYQSISGIPLDFTQITGAQHLAIYGVIYHPGIDKRKSNRV